METIVATINPSGKTIFVADAHRGDGRRFIVRADEKLSAFVELERQVLNRDVLSRFNGSNPTFAVTMIMHVSVCH